LRIKTTDAQAKLQFVMEVDDPQQTYTHLVVVVSANAEASRNVTLAGMIPYRAKVAEEQIPYVQPEVALPVDGAWHPLVLQGNQILKGTQRYVFRRWSHVRIIGNVEVDEVGLQASK
jgi:hypothetical protein